MLTNTLAGDATPSRALKGELETLTVGLKFKLYWNSLEAGGIVLTPISLAITSFQS